MNRGGVSLRPGDGIITAGSTACCSQTRSALWGLHTRSNGISFPGGSGLVAFAAATGVMPLDMPDPISAL